MTLPFRRRHHDAESSHDRARALWSAAMLEPIAPADETWLTRHLAECGECRADHARYLADRELLRALRETPPEPPRDLWARTSAAIEREAKAGGRGLLGGRDTRRGRFGGLPLGAASGLLVVVVVVGTALLARDVPVLPPATSAPSSVAVVTIEPGPTRLEVEAATVSWLRPGADGGYEFMVADVDEVCPSDRPGCPHLTQAVRAPVKLASKPVAVTLSPVQDQLVVIAAADESRPSKVYVVPVPNGEPAPTPTAPGTPPTTPETSPTTEPLTPSPEPTTPGTVEIASGVTVVGELAYSPDGTWLAFSARPSDDTAGPDLYLWHVSWPSAQRVTDDGLTYFSSWLGGAILASRVEIELPEPAPSAEATGAPGSPTSEPPPTPLPTPVAEPTGPGDPDASPATGGAAGGGGGLSGIPADATGRPVSFLLDPATLAVTDLAEPNVWLPAVDPTGSVVVYWSGTVVPSNDLTGWLPNEGRLVLDRWLGLDDAATESPEPAAESPEPATATVEPGATDPAASEPAPTVGPVGEPTSLAEAPVAAFEARFDPTGTRLGVWTLDQADSDVGRLALYVVDLDAGTVDDSVEALPGVPARRGFSIDTGRIAWVTPPGQDGHESSVQVLAWKDRQFGHVETIPASEILVLR
jgi:hypothetical protein